MTWSTLEDVGKELSETTIDAMRFVYCSCDSALQQEHAAKLADLHDRLAGLRQGFIESSDEHPANYAMRQQLLCSAIRNILLMWIALKENKAIEAWDMLVEAQEDLRIAQRIFAYPAVAELIDNLLLIERLSFPPQLFLSAGYFYTESFCSICEQPSGECDHIQGRIYKGALCRRKVDNFVVHEASLVVTPENKRCRVEQVSRDGVSTCTITLAEVADVSKLKSRTIELNGSILRFD